MILRRLSKHVKDQNWFAVALDFIIVVLGVFIGLQISNWNDARAFDQLERNYLVQLKDEVELNRRITEYQIAYVDTVVESGKRALVYLESDRQCEADCADLLVDFFHASQVWGAPRTLTIFEEMERLGLPRDAEKRQTLMDLYRSLDGWDFVNLSPPAYRESVRGYFSPEVSEALWRDCIRYPDDVLEELVRDCVDDLRAMDTSAMLEDMRASPDLANQLRYWIGQNVVAQVLLPDALGNSDSAQAAIDEVLAR
ncbi:hypothetical protein [Henriciella litoralis]|uniref:hypothetical protein n=1 Tax=Henriciella litoralis TaxID=568102 RepID=UPI0009FF545C|nr:hypothetical protein [Henriciella litoralis]